MIDSTSALVEFRKRDGTGFRFFDEVVQRQLTHPNVVAGCHGHGNNGIRAGTLSLIAVGEANGWFSVRRDEQVAFLFVLVREAIRVAQLNQESAGVGRGHLKRCGQTVRAEFHGQCLRRRILGGLIKEQLKVRFANRLIKRQ